MLMQNFGVINKEHYGMLWYFWSGQLFLRARKLIKKLIPNSAMKVFLTTLLAVL